MENSVKHLTSEGIELRPDISYLTRHNISDLQKLEDNQTVEKGVIGSSNVYSKKIKIDEEDQEFLSSHLLGQIFLENFELSQLDIPCSNIEEEEDEAYFISEEVTGDRSPSEETVYNVASDLMLVGEIDWKPENIAFSEDTTYIIDLDFFASNGVINSRDFEKNIAATFFDYFDCDFDRERLLENVYETAGKLPETDEIEKTIYQELEQRETGYSEENIEIYVDNLLGNIEKAKDRNLDMEYLSDNSWVKKTA